MKAFLLLAGKSTRFWPLIEKTLFPVCGTTLLMRQVMSLRSGGVDDIVLIGGAHNLEAASALFPDLPRVEQKDLSLGMRGAVESALESHGEGPVLIVSGNDLFDPGAFRDLLESEGGGALLAYKVDRYFPGGYLEVDDSNRITKIIEKPGEGNEPSSLVNIVAHVHRDPRALFKTLQNMEGDSGDQYERALQKLFTSHDYRAVAYEGMWNAVKYPWHMLDVVERFLSEIEKPSIDPGARIHESAVIDGNVIVEEGVRIFEHAVIRGPAYLGKGTIVANNALVRQSSVGEGCIIGYNTEVKDSVLGTNVWTHMNYIGNSVIGNDVSFGGGTLIGNLRLDEEEISSIVQGESVSTGRTKFGAAVGNGCRFGIHVSINPGVKVGAGTFVSTASVLSKDIPEHSFVRMKNGELTVSENRIASTNLPGRDAFRARLD